MAVAHRAAASSTPASRPSGRARRRRVGWPNQADLTAFTPLVRLLSSLWSIDAVQRLGAVVDGTAVDLWVIMERENLDVETRISALEREYRVAGVPAGHAFTLHVVPMDRVDPELIPDFETILER